MSERLKRNVRLASVDPVDDLPDYHRRGWHGWLWVLVALVAGFIAWALSFRIDEVVQARGEIIASSRVQVIQSVDGGVLSELRVKEGDRVREGQVLARLDPERINATVGESAARVAGLQARAARLRAEVTERATVDFSAALRRAHPETVRVEEAFFLQRRDSLRDDLRVLNVAYELAKKELTLVEDLRKQGDASGSEVLRTQKALNEAESRLIARRNKFLDEARAEMAKIEDDLAQNQQVLTRKVQEKQATVFRAQVNGVVKNIRVTTVGGVLKGGEEIMQIVPVDDDLVLEAKVKPADIARIKPGLSANMRLDPFDYTVYGGVKTKVTYVSADTLKEDSRTGTDTYYRVHLVPEATPLVTTSGKPIALLPGMTAQVDIRTGDRTLMAYLLKPIRKTLAESLGEK